MGKESKKKRGRGNKKPWSQKYSRGASRKAIIRKGSDSKDSVFLGGKKNSFPSDGCFPALSAGGPDFPAFMPSRSYALSPVSRDAPWVLGDRVDRRAVLLPDPFHFSAIFREKCP